MHGCSACTSTPPCLARQVDLFWVVLPLPLPCWLSLSAGLLPSCRLLPLPLAPCCRDMLLLLLGCRLCSKAGHKTTHKGSQHHRDTIDTGQQQSAHIRQPHASVGAPWQALASTSEAAALRGRPHHAQAQPDHSGCPFQTHPGSAAGWLGVQDCPASARRAAAACLPFHSAAGEWRGGRGPIAGRHWC